MKNLKITLELFEYAGPSELPVPDQDLLKHAWKSCENAYAPYSRFYVGAAVRLANGKIIPGNNQENSAYPSGLCAERVAVFSASAQYPGIPIESIALVARTDVFALTTPVTPCGACRQVISEYEQISGIPIRIVMQSANSVYVSDGIENMLPLMFKAPGLKI
jgi:cytidine deaminase